ncbi:hypothetical protein HPP92_023543 [Vanilla planifolia]|uniref:Uncharacterized protein n=1 Tax=Vanilla planifolia TaxID=51239 RepID=A0A835PU06_VANPL|nr:hypothetical protein HPP92_023543 [Vanilla planifolia]
MEAEAEIFEPLEIHYSDLVLLSSSGVSCSYLSLEEQEKIETISGAVLRALGPSGPGLLSITGVPRAAALRRALLPMARELALLDKKERAEVLKLCRWMMYRMWHEQDRDHDKTFPHKNAGSLKC